ncbi:hypothetical protein [Abiotrophia defectiva]|uniref:hypothetical protein n=1 Tax=Abiotrophia defectiva TaxID=46125 RepID=UPI0028D0D256|nr:hypothetical protein [Abiotrophia defectiva]
MNTTMKEMQAIEREAEALRRDYQEQVTALGQVGEEELAEVIAQFDQVTQALVAEEEAQLEARYQVAQEELASIQEASQALVEQVLAGQREHWLQHILTKVVDNYGR